MTEPTDRAAADSDGGASGDADRVMSDRVMSDEQVDTNWLGAVLGRPGELDSIDRRSIGTGQVGENVRYALHWNSEPASPSTVVGKFPSLDPQSRATGGATSAYVREVGFYRDAQRTVDVSTPRIHHIDEDIDANAFVLIMDDLAPAEQGDQLAGCSVEEAELAIDQAIALHRPHWGGDFAEHHPWAAGRDEEGNASFVELVSMVIGPFVERYTDRLDDDTLTTARWLAANMEAYTRSQRTPATLVHGDFRLDNMLFAPPGRDAPPLTIVDWQTASMGRGPADAAYFVGAGLPPALRQEAEPALMNRYVDGIVSAVGPAAVRDDVEFDYRVGAAAGLTMAIVASQIVGRTERGDEMFCVMAERHSAQMHDLGTLDLIDAV